MALCVALAMSVSCSKEAGMGTFVRFKAVSPGSVPQTKTVYSNAQSGAYERIDWVVGDEMRVWSDNATDRYDESLHWSDYVVKKVNADGRFSKASIENLTDSNGLVWTDEESASFWGVCPSPHQSNLVKVTSYDVAGASKGVVTASIASSQSVTLNESTGEYDPDMKYALMLSWGEGSASSGDISLDFYPAFTAYEFELTGLEEEVLLKSIKIKSSASSVSNRLAGDYTVTLGSEANSFSVTTGTGSKAPLSEVTLTLPGSGVALSADKKVTCTLFTLPLDASEITLSITRTATISGSAVSRTNSLALKKDGSWLTFGASKKHKFKGIITPTVDEIALYDLRVGDWQTFTSSEVTLGN